MPQQTREDLVNCTLFAQLAASAAVTDPQRIAEWYAAYFKTLTAIGWAQSDTQFEEYDFKSKTAEAHKAIIKVLTVLLGPAAAALTVVQTVLEALQSMNENSPWITLFDRQSKTGKSARFQVATAQLDPGGLLQVALVGFELAVKASLTQVLFVKYASNSTRLRYAAGKATIYEAALKDQREALAARLAAYRSAYVAQIPLPPLPALPSPPAAGTRSVSRGGAHTDTDSLARNGRSIAAEVGLGSSAPRLITIAPLRHEVAHRKGSEHVRQKHSGLRQVQLGRVLQDVPATDRLRRVEAHDRNAKTRRYAGAVPEQHMVPKLWSATFPKTTNDIFVQEADRIRNKRSVRLAFARGGAKGTSAHRLTSKTEPVANYSNISGAGADGTPGGDVRNRGLAYDWIAKSWKGEGRESIMAALNSYGKDAAVGPPIGYDVSIAEDLFQRVVKRTDPFAPPIL